jgi:uncharacterized protein (TIGR03437 family)
MKCSISLIVLCAGVSGCAFGQSASVNLVAGMGYLYPPVTVAPGQLISILLQGNVQDDISATVAGLSAPILEVRPGSGCPASTLCSFLTAVTIQIPNVIEPCGYPPVCNVVSLAQLIVTVNGVAGPPINLTPLPDRVHILTACDTVVPSGSGIAPSFSALPCAPLVTHADGSAVTSVSPAHGGEVVVAYAVGLGLTTPIVPAGQAATAATPTSENFALDFNFLPNALATQPVHLASCDTCPMPVRPMPLYSGLVPGYVGLYQINFTVPPPPVGVQPCSATVQSNLTVSVGGLASFDGAGICVAPSTP